MDKNELIERMKSLGSSGIVSKDFQNADESLRGDKDVCLEAIRHDCSNLRYATDELKKDLEVIFEAFKINPYIWEYVNEDIKNDKNILLKAINGLDVGHWKSTWALDIVPEKLKNDKDIIFALLEKGNTCEEYFKQLDDSVKNDRDFVLEAVKRNGNTIYFFSREFFKDREVVCEALKDLKLGREAGNILEDIEDIKPEFCADKELMTFAARNKASMALYCATEEVKEDRNFILAAAENDMEVLMYQLPEELRSDKEVLQRVMQKLSSNMEKAMTVPKWIREYDIKGWRYPVNESSPYIDIRTDFTYEILDIIKYFDSDLLEEYKEMLVEYSAENFLSEDAIRECAEEKGEGPESVIESIASNLQQRYEQERLRIKAELERKQAERQAEEKKEEIQEPKVEVDERTAEIQKALAGLQALNLSAEEIDKLTAQLSQLKAIQTQRNMGEADVGKGE